MGSKEISLNANNFERVNDRRKQGVIWRISVVLERIKVYIGVQLSF